ncbi:unnamed protein product, partial [Urochloa humidicola]
GCVPAHHRSAGGKRASLAACADEKAEDTAAAPARAGPATARVLFTEPMGLEHNSQLGISISTTQQGSHFEVLSTTGMEPIL